MKKTAPDRAAAGESSKGKNQSSVSPHHAQASRPAHIEAELVAAMRFARDPRIQPDFAKFGFSRAIQWGVARVEFIGPQRSLYEPREDGPSLTLILPVIEDDELVDLVAIDHRSQHVSTRLGIGRAFGHDEVAKARMGAGLLLHDRPLAWLRNPYAAAYLFDLAQARIALDRVPRITCGTSAFARRVRSLFPPSERHRIDVASAQQETRHAA
jgi:hypothetical protein